MGATQDGNFTLRGRLMSVQKMSHEEDLFKPGHRACPGCGAALAIKYTLEAAGPNTIIVASTGCMEVCTTPYPESAWGVSWIHNLFENAAAVASGIEVAYRAFQMKGKRGYMNHDDVNFIVFAGDGATFDIGTRSLSGMMERGHDVLYICYDNEAYMNTGVQRSGSTPYGASTTTSPPGRGSFGKDKMKKDMPAFAAAHGCKYIATATIGYPEDFKRKVRRALKLKGPKYIQVLCPCPTGWHSKPEETVKLGRLAVETGLYPVFERVNGKITDVKRPPERKPVEKYLELQGRFKHLFKMDGGDRIIKRIQEVADSNAERYGF